MRLILHLSCCFRASEPFGWCSEACVLFSGLQGSLRIDLEPACEDLKVPDPFQESHSI